MNTAQIGVPRPPSVPGMTGPGKDHPMTEDDAPVVVSESPSLSALDVADDAARRADAYGQGASWSAPRASSWWRDWSPSGGRARPPGAARRRRRTPAGPQVHQDRAAGRLVVAIGTVGGVSLDALRWCVNVGTPVVVLGGDGAILAASIGHEDARLLRAQALALYGPAGIEVTRYLIVEKLHGQAGLLAGRLGAHNEASTLLGLAESVEVAGSIEEVRQLEAAGANVYFAAWERGVEVAFVRRDLDRLPEHWRRFNGRRSALNPGSPRSATDPVGAMLNYGYKLAEIEADSGVPEDGPQRKRRYPPCGRRRPAVVLLRPDGGDPTSCRWSRARPRSGSTGKRETEDERGVVRCLAPLTTRLAEAMAAYGWALGPVIEHVGMILAKSSPYDVTVQTVISGAKHKAAAKRRADTERRERGGPRGPGVPGMKPRGNAAARPPRPSHHLCRWRSVGAAVGSSRSTGTALAPSRMVRVVPSRSEGGGRRIAAGSGPSGSSALH